MFWIDSCMTYPHVRRSCCIAKLVRGYLAACVVVGSLWVPITRGQEDRTAPRPWYVGGDVSALPLREKMGAVFRTAQGQPGDALDIFREQGANCFRVRLFVAPNGGGHVVNDLEYTLALSKRIQASGANLLLNFHYSDTWADPGRQEVPSAWRGLSHEELTSQVAQYTYDTINAFMAAGTPPQLVQIGNEIDNGFLTTHERIWSDSGVAWREFAQLFQAGVRGVRRAEKENQPIPIIFHSATGGKVRHTRSLLKKLVEHGFVYDIHGLSYYPWWHGDLDGLKQSIDMLVKEFDKDVMLVEVAYPWRTPHPQSKLWNGIDGWETTPAGQAAFLRDVNRTVFAAPQGRGLGVLWWFPESMPVANEPTWNGGDTALFDSDGRPLPALSVFREFRR